MGGGVGGLTAAIALRRVGVEARVLERAPELREVGAGIGLWANAIHVFERLGLGAAIRGLGGESLGGAVLTRHGRRLTSQPAAILEARWGAPTIAVLRSDLQALLLAELPGETIALGAEVTGLEVTGGRVELSLIDGDVTSADLVVGADGLRSVVRAHLLGDEPASLSRATPPGAGSRRGDSAEGLAGASELWGRGSASACYRVEMSGRCGTPAPTCPKVGEALAASATKLLGRFGRWPDPIPAVLDATPPEAIVRNDVYDRSVTRRWVSGRIALVGDAAHPMTPDLGQGACQAIVDAWVLADGVRRTDRLETALREYQRRRWPTAAIATVLARNLGRVGQWQHPVACRVRDEAMRATPLALQLWPLDAVMRTD